MLLCKGWLQQVNPYVANKVLVNVQKLMIIRALLTSNQLQKSTTLISILTTPFTRFHPKLIICRHEQSGLCFQPLKYVL